MQVGPALHADPLMNMFHSSPSADALRSARVPLQIGNAITEESATKEGTTQANLASYADNATKQTQEQLATVGVSASICERAHFADVW